MKLAYHDSLELGLNVRVRVVNCNSKSVQHRDLSVPTTMLTISLVTSSALLAFLP